MKTHAAAQTAISRSAAQSCGCVADESQARAEGPAGADGSRRMSAQRQRASSLLGGVLQRRQEATLRQIRFGAGAGPLPPVDISVALGPIQRMTEPVQDPPKVHHEDDEPALPSAEDSLVKAYFDSRPTKHRFRKKVEQQRVLINVEKNELLIQQLASRKKRGGGRKEKKKTFIDPTYHETAAAVDAEREEFFKFAAGHQHLSTEDKTRAYDRIVQAQTAAESSDAIDVVGPSPLTAMTPILLRNYQNAHYVAEKQVEDETSSTRTYEDEYTRHVTTELPFSVWRDVVLPSAKSDDSLVTAMGATLDVQTPTAGKSVGSGKATSVVYKHFQRTMELHHQALDAISATEDFMARTAELSKLLDKDFMAGTYAHEKANVETSGFSSWDGLKRAIDEIYDEILLQIKSPQTGSGGSTSAGSPLSPTRLTGTNLQRLKKFELIGAILGLMIKKEKRLMLNCAILKDEKGQQACLATIQALRQVENIVNLQKDEIAKLQAVSRRRGEQRGVSKELADLKFGINYETTSRQSAKQEVDEKPANPRKRRAKKELERS